MLNLGAGKLVLCFIFIIVIDHLHAYSFLQMQLLFLQLVWSFFLTWFDQ